MTTSKAFNVVERYKKAMRQFTIPRSSYLPPQVRGTEPYIPEGTDMAVWKYEVPSPGGDVILYYAIAFVAKQNKPLFHYRFRDSAHRDREIEKAAENRRLMIKVKEERQQERREFKHDLKEGDILYSSWGYDQTNCNFYEVIKVLGQKVIEIRELAQKTVRAEGVGDYVVPTPGQYARHSRPMRKQVAPGNSVRIESYAHAHKWDGKPKYQTSALYGH
jgi:hypothetical protein